MSVLELIQAMRDAQCDDAQILRAVAAAERRREDAQRTEIESKRAKDRDRKRAARASAVSGDVPQCPADNADSADSADNSPPPPSGKKVPDPKKTQTPSTPPKNPPSGVKKGSRLPADWRPSAELKAWARTKERLPDAVIDRETEKFCDWWPAQSGKAGVKLDWNRTWKNWIRSAAERIPDSEKLRNPNPAASSSAGLVQSDEKSVDGQRQLVSHYKKTGKWLGRIMQPPDDPATRLRPDVLREFGYLRPDDDLFDGAASER